LTVKFLYSDFALLPDESKKRYNKRPPRNPPIWAQNAIPVALFESISDVVPLSNCPRNHIAIKTSAGIGRKKGMMNMGMNETTVLFGNINIYAAMIPDMAPEAPMAGTAEFL